MDPTLLQTLDSTRPVRLLVLGDLILDQYTYGEAERVSQEAPILVLRAADQQSRLGGAANVAHMAHALGAEVHCGGVIGADASGQQLRQLLQAAGIDDQAVISDPQRCTTVKERFVGRTDGRNPHQMLRVDRETRMPLADDMQQQLARQLLPQIDACDAVLISDYGKGVCTNELLRIVIDAARQYGKPLLVDPLRGGDYARYRGATLLKPNRVETAQATEQTIATAVDALRAAEALCRLHDVRMAVVTLDRDGMAFYDERSGASELISTEARDVYDITGAGDMVLAALGVFLSLGAAPADALRLANIAAGLEVEQVGVVVITRQQIRDRLQRQLGPSAKIIDRDEAARLADAYRQQGRRIAFTNGCFDLLHAGHVMSLQAARNEGDVLFVGVNCDAVIRQLKGPERPIISERERMAVLAALACVDHVVLFHEPTPHALLRAVRPDILVKGGTYSPQEVVGREVVESYGGTIRVTPVVDGLSTTNIVDAVRRRSA